MNTLFALTAVKKADQQFFKDRSVFYSTFPIRDQAPRGPWDYELKSVYTIGILNFVFDEDKYDREYFHHEVKLMDVNKLEVFYDKLTFIYLEMPKFTKGLDELDSLFDKWMYVLKNLPDLMERPVALQERVFKRVFSVAEIAKFNREERLAYEHSLKVYRDWYSVFRTAKIKSEAKGFEKGHARGLAEGLKEGMEKGMAEGMEKGMAEGMEKGRAEGMEKGMAEGMAKGMAEGMEKGRAEGEREKQLEIARNFKSLGIPVVEIARGTGLSVAEIEAL